MNIDNITVKRIKKMHPILRGEVYCMYLLMCEALTSPYVKLRFSWTFRSKEQQKALYAQGRTKPGNVVTWTRNSTHMYGLAFDIVLLIDTDRNGSFETASWNTYKDWDHDTKSDWLEVAEIAQAHGWQWGIRSKKGKRIDKPHFQKTYGYSVRQLQHLPVDVEGYPILNSTQKPAV